jgi:hypothetical protein
MALGTVPLRTISPPSSAMPPDVAAVGPVIPPIERLRIMSASTWEDLVLEYAHWLKTRYARVDKCGGAGDMGRDIIAFESATTEDPWDNYQCKHYDHPLAPNDIWLELGKLAYYTFAGEYSMPRHYTFVAPQGVGNSLSKLLRRPDELRSGLIAAWDKRCQRSITSQRAIPLEGALKDHIASMDFTIFDALPPLRLIEEHAQTPWHIVRFGGGLPFRGSVPPPPPTIAVNETNYVRALLDAYEDRLGSALPSPDAIADPDLVDISLALAASSTMLSLFGNFLEITCQRVLSKVCLRKCTTE